MKKIMALCFVIGALASQVSQASGDDPGVTTGGNPYWLRCVSEITSKAYWLLLNEHNKLADIYEGTLEKGNYVSEDTLLFEAASVRRYKKSAGDQTLLMLEVVGRDNSITNWEEEPKCWRAKQATHKFNLKLNDGAKITGDMTFIPHIDLDPSQKFCSIPRVARPIPQGVVCVTGSEPIFLF